MSAHGEIRTKKCDLTRHLQWCSTDLSQCDDGKRYWHFSLKLTPQLTNDTFLVWHHLVHAFESQESCEEMLQPFCPEKKVGQSLTASAVCGMPLVHAAVLTSNITLLGALSVQEASVERLDGFGALDLACAKGDAAAVHILLEKGLAADRVLPNGMTPLLIACQANATEVVLRLLKAACGDVNHSTDTCMTSLHWAVFHNNEAICAELLTRTAALHLARRSDHFTALHLAFAKNHLACAKLMLQHADGESLRLLSCEQRSCLHYGAASGSLEAFREIGSHRSFVRLLPELLSQTDVYGLTPLRIAVRSGSHLCMLWLSEHASQLTLAHSDYDAFGAQFVRGLVDKRPKRFSCRADEDSHFNMRV